MRTQGDQGIKGGYSSNASLVYQSWLKDYLCLHVLECCLSQWEAIQLVKDYTSEHAQLEVEYYLGLTPKSEQSFQGLIDHLTSFSILVRLSVP